MSPMVMEKKTEPNEAPQPSVSTEFVQLAPGIARSDRGFTVLVHPEGGVEYSDSISGQIRVATELFHKPVRYMVYANSMDLSGMTNVRAEEILSNVKRAMEFLRYPAEIRN
jgi:hypothetical protein